MSAIWRLLPMYGHAPPAVIAIDAELLRDCGAFQALAGAIQSEVQRRPTWAVIGAPEWLHDSDDPVAAVEALYRHPQDAPQEIDSLDVAIAEALAHHLAELGVALRVHRAPVADQPHAPPSGIVAGTWRDAAATARAVGASCVFAWASDARLVPIKVSGMPFAYAIPGA